MSEEAVLLTACTRVPPVFQSVGKVITLGYYKHPHNPRMHGIRLIYEIAIMGVLHRIFDLYWQAHWR